MWEEREREKGFWANKPVRKLSLPKTACRPQVYASRAELYLTEIRGVGGETAEKRNLDDANDSRADDSTI